MPQYKQPLAGSFQNVQFKLFNLYSPPLIFNVTCFLVKAKNNVTNLGYSGYLGLAPLKKGNAEYSFLEQLRKVMITKDKIGILYQMNKNNPLAPYTGNITFIGINSKRENQIKQKYEFSKDIPLSNIDQVVESTDINRPFYNNLTIKLGNYIHSMKIQDFEAFDNFTYQDSQMTYLNMSDIGLKMNVENYAYFNRSFLNYLCYFNDTSIMRACLCRGNSFQGMPELTFNTRNKSFQLLPPDYLLFPKIEPSTRQTRCSMSLYHVRHYNYSDPLEIVTDQDYVLGQVFLAKYNPTFVLEYDDELDYISLTLYMEKYNVCQLCSGQPTERDSSLVIAVSSCSLVLFGLTTILTRKKSQRMQEQHKRWKDIKELEEDYDVYVSDEYAYHISDLKVTMDQLQNLEQFGMSRDSEQVLRTSGYSTRAIAERESSTSEAFKQLRMSQMKKKMTKRRIVSADMDKTLSKESNISMNIE